MQSQTNFSKSTSSQITIFCHCEYQSTVCNTSRIIIYGRLFHVDFLNLFLCRLALWHPDFQYTFFEQGMGFVYLNLHR